MKGITENPHTLKIDETIAHFQTSEKGLTEEEAKKRLSEHGHNVLPEKKKFSVFLLLLRQFRSWLVIILIVAAVISWFANHITDMLVIVAVIVVNAAIGFIQEFKAEKAVSSLQKLVVKTAKVIRNNELKTIPSANLVPGDVMVLEEGDSIPADGRIIFSRNLRTLEAALTGESLPISKEGTVCSTGTALGDQKNMCWSGTFVAGGYAKVIVTATGVKTALGNISQTLDEIKETPLDFVKKTNVLARQMGIMAIVSALFIFLIGYVIRDFEMNEILLMSIAVLVAAVPEGLPAIISIILAIGARRMAKKGAIVREFHATETLGTITTILTDKTGTLTHNSLTVKKLFIPGDDDEIDITGQGWLPIGNFCRGETIINPEKIEDLQRVLSIAALSNNSDLRYNEEDDTYEMIGDPTEGALNVLARKGGLKPNELSDLKLDDLPFNSHNKLRATLIDEHNSHMAYVVGAPEQLLEESDHILSHGEICPLSEQEKDKIQDKIDEWSNAAMRVIALAYKEQNEDTLTAENMDHLVIAAIVGMIDPPRVDVKEAVHKCKKAGIRVMMLTGDHVNTAVAIAKTTGILEKNSNGDVEALTQQQLLKLNDHEFEKAIESVSVFARLTPKMKLKIAGALQSKGEIIAMTGDGVNDAPALKRADIGISMGIMGTDVARENSEIVLADDNFSTIVSAIEQGRIIFSNAQRTSFFLITTNIAESATLLITLALGMPPPLIATQILWLNLVTDSLPAIALANEKGHKNILVGKANNKKRILNKNVFSYLILNVTIMAGLSIGAFYYYLPSGIDLARTTVFIIMASTQLFNVYNLRSLDSSIFTLGLLSNKFVNWATIISFLMMAAIIQIPFFAEIFHFQPINWVEFGILIAISSAILFFGELLKLVKRRM